MKEQKHYHHGDFNIPISVIDGKIDKLISKNIEYWITLLTN